MTTLDPRALIAARTAFDDGEKLSDQLPSAIAAYLAATQPQAGEPVPSGYGEFTPIQVGCSTASPQPANPAQVTDAMVEKSSRAICTALGHDPNDWIAYKSEATAALTAAIGAGSAEPSLLDRERAAMDVTQRRAIEGERISDAVLAWMVKYDLLDAGNEYHVSDVLAVLDDLAPSDRSAAIGAGGQAVAVKPLRAEIEKLCCRGYDNGVELVARNTVLGIIDDASLLADSNAWYSAAQLDEIKRGGGNV